jgi:hypothetical protein
MPNFEPDKQAQAILQEAKIIGQTPVPISRIANAWGFEVFVTNLASHQVTGGLFDLYDNQQNIYLEQNNSSLENDFILAYLLSLWNVLDPSRANCKTLIEKNFEKYGQINKEALHLDSLDKKQQEAFRLAISLMVPASELTKLHDKTPLTPSLLALKFGVPLRLALYVLEKDEIYLTQSFNQDYNF